MDVSLVVHVTAGGLGIVSGFAALSVTKGVALHRRIGVVFVCVMLTTAGAGLAISVSRGVTPAINVPAALVTADLVVTGLITLRPPARNLRGISLGAMLVAMVVGLASLALGFDALADGGSRNGIPAFPFFLFGVVGLSAGASDVRIVRSGPLRGPPRLARHLWRRCFALFIAAMSFFLGQADEIPEELRMPALLAVPISIPLLAMAYWLWQVRSGRLPRGRPDPTGAPLRQSLSRLAR